ncbi:beta-galactosidase domain 4-containing protein [Streptomyces sp. NPDC052002]
MGNGPGGLAEYLRLCDEYPRVQGGYVWEWMDQGLRTRDARGREFFGYGGDFGEDLHDGNFICDGLVLPDRTPSPGLLEYAKAIAPVRIGPGPEPDTLTVENHYEVLDLSHLRFTWSLAREGVELAQGVLPTPELAAGEHGRLPLPRLDPPPATAGRRPQSGEEAAGELWLTVQAELAKPTDWAPEGHLVAWGQLRLSATGRRRPVGLPGPARMEGEQILLAPGRFDRITGALLGIGGPYPDSCQAVRVGRFCATVDELQTPYVRPQENGNRADVRWAAFTDRAGNGLRVAGEDPFHFAARRWTDRQLDAARHHSDLVPGPVIHLHTDHAVQGLGTAAVGPGVLPQYRLGLAPADFAFIWTPLQ